MRRAVRRLICASARRSASATARARKSAQRARRPRRPCAAAPDAFCGRAGVTAAAARALSPHRSPAALRRWHRSRRSQATAPPRQPRPTRLARRLGVGVRGEDAVQDRRRRLRREGADRALRLRSRQRVRGRARTSPPGHLSRSARRAACFGGTGLERRREGGGVPPLLRDALPASAGRGEDAGPRQAATPSSGRGRGWRGRGSPTSSASRAVGRPSRRPRSPARAMRTLGRLKPAASRTPTVPSSLGGPSRSGPATSTETWTPTTRSGAPRRCNAPPPAAHLDCFAVPRAARRAAIRERAARPARPPNSPRSAASTSSPSPRKRAISASG